MVTATTMKIIMDLKKIQCLTSQKLWKASVFSEQMKTDTLFYMCVLNVPESL